MDKTTEKFYVSILIASAVIGIVVSYLIVAIIRKNRKIMRLAKQISYAELKAHEQERSRIAADLHDDLAPSLSLVKMLMQDVHVLPNDEEMLQRAIDQITNVLSRIREITNNITPLVIMQKGLVKGIEGFISNFSNTSHLKITFEYHDIPSLPAEMALNVYRIVQEIMFNTFKHAQANELMIEMRTEKNKLILATRDDGIGYNYSTVMSENSGTGLLSIHSRINLLNGKFFLDSMSGKGTTYVVEIPLYQNPIISK